jgi:hypothetical protein
MSLTGKPLQKFAADIIRNLISSNRSLIDAETHLLECAGKGELTPERLADARRTHSETKRNFEGMAALIPQLLTDLER